MFSESGHCGLKFIGSFIHLIHFLERAEGVLPSPQLLFSTSIEYVCSSLSWARWVAWWLLRLLSWSKLNVNAHSPVFTAYLEHEHGPADDL